MLETYTILWLFDNKKAIKHIFEQFFKQKFCVPKMFHCPLFIYNLFILFCFLVFYTSKKNLFLVSCLTEEAQDHLVFFRFLICIYIELSQHMLLSWININITKLNYEFTWNNLLLKLVFNIELTSISIQVSNFLWSVEFAIHNNSQAQQHWILELGSKLKYLNLDQPLLW